ncbi:hypothetical protein HPB50_019815 [Hyalomma asiaticum]|uniref:Uncharacterized protein n=1 Tax=Hyalomma asiaticum TaxID=266040 RepID=A0ACB7S1B3_HYAAI|nr:hypothetical protein HPB50_019815 [Hyalomma asiaticum]
MTAAAKRKLQIAAQNPQTRLFIYSSSPDQTLGEFASCLCQVTLITPDGLNAPANRFDKCVSRQLVSAKHLFNQFIHERTSTKKIDAVTLAGRSNKFVRHIPESTAIIDAYRSKNISVELIDMFDNRLLILNKSADITLLGFPALASYEWRFLVDAHYPPAELCIFSKPVSTVQVYFVESTLSLVWFFVLLLSLGLAVLLLAGARVHLLFRHCRFRSAGVVLYITAALLGRSAPSSVGNATPYRTAGLVSWLVGAFFLGNYVQTTLIAIRSVPTSSTGVPDLATLRNLVTQGKVELCVTGYWRGVDVVHHAYSMNLAENDFIVKAIARIRERAFPFKWPLQCYEKARDGSHVTLSLCTEDEILVARRWNLLPGERCGLVNRMGLVLKTNPTR